MTATVRLPEGRLAEQVRRAYARDTLAESTLSLLRECGADDLWFAPRKAVLARNLAAIVFFFALKGALPREAETVHLASGSDEIVGSSAGRWLRELRETAHRMGPDSADQQLLDAIEALRAAVTRAHGGPIVVGHPRTTQSP
jgi:hypothetical protein